MPTSRSLSARLQRLRWAACAVLVSHVLLLLGCSRTQAAKPSPGAPPAHPSPPAAPPQFSDAAESLGIRMTREHGGTGRFYYPEFAGGGGALFDYDGDGWLDIYVVQGGPLPGYRESTPLRNRLYRNVEGRQFVDVTDQAGIDGKRGGKKTYGMGCAVGDIDNDGDTDLFVSGLGACLLYRNRGDGRFEEVSASAGIRSTNFGSSAAFFDYDNDGRLDLFVCEYVNYRVAQEEFCFTPDRKRDYCRPRSYPPSQSRLYRNVGSARFQDATVAAGLTAPGKALGVVIGDIDDDGDPDIYLACDLTPNLLYINQGDGRFVEEAVSRNCALSENGLAQSGMGVDMADVDGDLLPDLWVTNYCRENNNLYRNLGEALFTDVARTAPPGPENDQEVCFGSGLVDVNNDGWLDVFVSNGHVLQHPEQATPGIARAQKDQLFLNLGRGQFAEVSEGAGPWFSTRHVGRGAAFGDIDNDGDLDVLSVPNEGKVAVLRNEGGNRGNWLQLRLQGRASNRDGIGARIQLTLGSRVIRDEVRSAYSYCSANDLRAHFGLGTAPSVDKVEIRWPRGRVDTFTGVAANRIYTITEGVGIR